MARPRPVLRGGTGVPSARAEHFTRPALYLAAVPAGRGRFACRCEPGFLHGLPTARGRRAAFACFRLLGRYAPWTFQESREGSSFITLARRGERKRDDLLQLVTIRRLAGWLRASGLEQLREDRHVTGFFRRYVPRSLRLFLLERPWFQDVMIGHVQCVLRKP